MCSNVQWIFVRIRMELVHTGDKQLVGFFLQCIDADNVIFEGFGVFKIGEIFQKIPHFFTAFQNNFHQGDRVRLNFFNVINVDADEHIFDLISDVVNILTECDDIFSLDGRNEI